MSDDRIDIKFGADAGPLKAGTAEAGTAVRAATAGMAESFAAMHASVAASTAEINMSVKGMAASIENTMAALTGGLSKIIAIVTGAVFGLDKAVNATQDWDKESMKLASTMGITTEKATALIDAGTALGITSEMISGAVKGMERALSTNEKAFIDLGVATRDSNGHYRNAVDIMLDANKVLAETKEGFDRDIAGKKLYGRSWDEVRKIVKLTEEEMTAAARRADALGLTVGPQGAAQTSAYGKAMREVKETLLALWKVVGDAVIPLLTQLGEWFVAIGPSAVNVFRAVINSAMIVVESFVGVLTVLYDTVMAVVTQVVMGFVLVGKVIAMAMSGDLKGAARVAKAEWADMGFAWKQSLAEMAKDSEDYNKRIGRLLQFKPEKGKSAPKTGGNTVTGDEGKKDEKENDVAIWREELEKTKELNKDFYKDSTKADLAFWQGKLETIKGGSKEEIKNRTEVGHIIFELEKKMALDSIAAQLQGMKSESEAVLKGSHARIDIAQREADLIKSKYGAESKEHIAAMGEVAKMQREYADDQVKRMDMEIEKKRELDTILLDMDKQRVAYLKEIGAVSDAEEIARMRRIESQKQAIAMDALQQEIATAKQGSIERQKLVAELEKMDAKNKSTMLGFDLKSSAQTVSVWKSAYETIANSFSSSIQKMLLSGGKLKDEMKSITSSILGTFVDMAVKSAAKWLWMEVLKTNITAAYTAIRNALGFTSDAVAATSSVASADVQVAANASVAASGAAAAVAPIPFIGPALAVAAGAAMLAMVLGMKPSHSASGGFDIPSGVNPVTQLHSEEMVLPANIANPLRSILGGKQYSIPAGINMAASAQSGTASPSQAVTNSTTNGGGVHFNVSALDGHSVAKFFAAHGSTIATVVRQQSRNFNPAVS